MKKQDRGPAAPWPLGKPVTIDTQTLMYAILVIEASERDPYASETHREACRDILSVLCPAQRAATAGSASASEPPALESAAPAASEKEGAP